MAELTDKEKEQEQPKHDTTIDPYFKNILNAMGKSVDDVIDPELKPQGDEAASGKTEETPEQKAEREKKEADEKAAKEAEEKAKLEAAEKAKQPPVETNLRPIVVKKKEEVLALKPDEDEQKYIAGLTDEQRDELELAAFAEENGKPGHRAKVLDYYRKLDKFVEEHPDAEPESEEFKEFKEKHEPKLGASERRKIERAMIVQQATATARKEVAKEFEPVVSELNSMKSEPVLRKVATEVQEALTKSAEDGAEPLDAEVVKKIIAMPMAKAMEEFPIEAPIVNGATIAAQEWTLIWNGVSEVDMKNSTHSFLMQFIAHEEQQMLALPKEKQIRDGRQFIRMADYARLQKENPAALPNYYTFNHGDIAGRIATHGVRQYNAELKKLEKSGFKRAKPEAKSGTPEIKPAENAGAAGGSGSPKATGRTMVGADAGGQNNNNADMPAHLREVARVMNTA